MLRSRRSRPRWPPPPSVEDEALSLSRELNGLSGLGGKPDLEDNIFRGTVDQYPILIPLHPTLQQDLHVQNSDLRKPKLSGWYNPSTATGLRSSHILGQRTVQKIPTTSSRPLTLAERLEDKLKQRRALRHLQTSGLDAQACTSSGAELAVLNPDTLMNCPAKDMLPPKISMETPLPASAPDSPTANSGLSDASTLQNPTPPAGIHLSIPPLTSSTRSSSQSPTKRIVKFSDQGTDESIPKTQAENGHSTPKSDLCLLPCPRSIPTMGYQDWYTIQGLNHLDICPSCMGKIGESKFHDYFIPSLPKPANQRVRCSFSEPWTRLAWIQTIKQNHNHLGMLYLITLPTPETPPCPGRIPSTQYWYRLIDPETGTYLPNFDICPSCTRNLRILMPQHHHTFTLSPIPQPRICDFTTDSPRFIRYIDLLDTPPQSPTPDLTPFLTYTRRKTTLPDCPRHHPLPLHSSTWHYIRDLPELTICEDCYDEVIRPFSKTGKPLARLFSPSPRPLPLPLPLLKSKNKNTDTRLRREVSCQLYSPRMRAKVRDAVGRNDYAYLRALALRRFHAELRFRGRMKELLEGCSWWGGPGPGPGGEWGWDWELEWEWEAEVRAVEEEWRAWE